MKASPSITVVVNAHREGELAEATLRAVGRAADDARAHDIAVETIGVLDAPDDATVAVFERWAAETPNARVRTTLVDDLGRARNEGVAAARGAHVAFMDADDLCSANWLWAAHRAAHGDARCVVWHPEANLYFGARRDVLHHPDMDDPDFRLGPLAAVNYWTALAFAPRDLLLRVPYRATDLSAGVGFEDWTWNMDAIAAGAVHKTVRGAFHAIRARPGSLLARSGRAGALPHPNDLFRHHVAERGARG